MRHPICFGVHGSGDKSAGDVGNFIGGNDAERQAKGIANHIEKNFSAGMTLSAHCHVTFIGIFPRLLVLLEYDMINPSRLALIFAIKAGKIVALKD